MPNEFVCLVKDLPESIQRELRCVDYYRKDIHVQVKDSESLACDSGQGYKAFTVILNLATGEHEALWGSWGGSNIFNPTNRVDLDNRSRVLGENVAVIKGRIGGNATYATVTIGTRNIIPMLQNTPNLSLLDKQILYCFTGIKSGQYRKAELVNIRASETDINSLIERGFLKKDKRGIQATISGKNAIAGIRSMPLS